jgi:hypothetical protein
VGHGTTAAPLGPGLGSVNDGITPLASGDGNGKHVAAGVGDAQPRPSNGPHDRPNGLKPLL